MASDQTIKNYTLQDIAKYHAGELSPAEMHALEKAALEDPFLSDALDGFKDEDSDSLAAIRELKTRLADRLEGASIIPLKSKGHFNWWKVAAMVIFIGAAGILTYQFVGNRRTEDLAVNKSTQTAAAPDTVLPQANTNVTIQQDTAVVFQETQARNNEERATISKSGTAPLPEPNATAKESVAIPAAPVSSVPALNTEQVATQSDDAAKPNKSPAANAENADQGFLGLTQAETKRKMISGNATAKSVATYRNAHVFRGRVTDNQNNALPFVNITNPVDNVGTYTDANGYFTLTSTDSVLNVQVKSLGFENSNIALNDKKTENRILMQEDRSLSARVLDTIKRNTNRVRNSTMKLEEPEPADGWSKYDTYIANNLNVPENLERQKSTGGEVELSFEVNKIGEPVNIKVEKSLCDICDKEAIRLLREGPKWKKRSKKSKTTVTVAF